MKRPTVYTHWHVEAPALIGVDFGPTYHMSGDHPEQDDIDRAFRTEAQARAFFVQRVKMTQDHPHWSHLVHSVRLVKRERTIVEEGKPHAP